MVRCGFPHVMHVWDIVDEDLSFSIYTVEICRGVFTMLLRLKQRSRTNAVLSTCSAPSFAFLVCDISIDKMFSVITQYVCVLIQYGKSRLHTPGMEGNLTLRSTCVRSHCSVSRSTDVLRPYNDYETETFFFGAYCNYVSSLRWELLTRQSRNYYPIS